MTSLNSDYRDLFVEFNRHQIKYLLVGGYAVMYYTEPRYTKDIDVLVKADLTNGKLVYKALASFGAPLSDIDEQTFTAPGNFFLMGIPPSRIDILTSIPGVEFESAWQRKGLVTLAGIEIPIISKSDLISAKRASARASDLADLERLEQKVKKLKIHKN